MFQRAHEPTTATPPVTTADTRTPLSVILVRTILTASGAAAIGIGAFLEWFRPNALAGTSMDWRVFYKTTALQNTVEIFRSAGGIMICIGVLALIGLVFRSGWITRLAGVLGLVSFGMYVATLYRANQSIGDAIGAGMWIILGASIVTVIAGFMTGTRYTARGALPETTTTSNLAATPAAMSLLRTDHECHVIPHDVGGWSVVGPGRDREISTYKTQVEAELRARELLSLDGGGELIVHKKSGKVRGRQMVAAA
jgi:hypothetical protein